MERLVSMDYREETFRAKFGHAARQLNVTPNEVVSLKVRENIGSSGEYHDLLRALDDVGLRHSPADGDLQGRGFVVADGNTKAIVVEHETGLEILYIAGSVASLISLIPLILQCWSAVRGRLSRRHPGGDNGVEIRRLDAGGHLHEEHAHDMPPSPPGPGRIFHTALAAAANVMECEMRNLVAEVQSLKTRVTTLEQQLAGTASGGGKHRTQRKPVKERGAKTVT
ncbi:MAG: hypothetical protein ACYDH9_24210 [Limisphaerales bacterium]